MENRENLIIVISSPSGAGKTTVCKRIIKKNKNICLSISDTTRKSRNNEINGVDYHFVSESEFKTNIKNHSYIEYANVFGNYYGSRKKNILDNFKNNKDTLFDIDWQGAEQLKKSSFKNIISIFIIPPSKDIIYQRLKLRAETSGDDLNSINNRMKKYETEMSHKKEYDHVVINKNLDECVKEVELIIANFRRQLVN